MDARTKASLRGPVESCRKDQVFFVRHCGPKDCGVEPEERRWSIMVRYRNDGKLAEQRHQNADGSEWTSVYSYDDAGLLQQMESRNRAGPAGKSIYQYDQNGRLERVVAVEVDGSERTVESFTYDSRGYKTKTFLIDPSVVNANTTCYSGIEGSDCAYSAQGATAITTCYDERDQPVQLLFHDSQQRLLSTVQLRYDDAGQLIDESQVMETEEAFPSDAQADMSPAHLVTWKTLFGVGSELSRQVHTYDAEGRRVQTQTIYGPVGGGVRTITYNEQGDQIEETSQHDSREFSIDDEGHIIEQPSGEKGFSSEARFTYQYDERGNWIEHILSSRSKPDQPFVVSSIDRRILTYYETEDSTGGQRVG